MAEKRLCSVEACDKPAWSRGWCNNHYQRWRLYGDPVAPSRARPRGTCSVPGCSDPCNGHGFCPSHYYRWKAYGDPLAPLVRNKWNSPTCSVEGCDRPRKRGAGMCVGHYLRWWRHGDPKHGRSMNGDGMSFIESALMSKNDECLTWPFARDQTGRAIINRSSHHMRTQQVSRMVCAMVHGDPPSPDHEAAHSCGNGHLGCVNPRHIRWLTHADNMAEIPIHRAFGRGPRSNALP